MQFLLPLTHTAIEDCKSITSNPDVDPAIIAYLTRYANILMCAEIESVVSRLIQEKIEQGCDRAVANFIVSTRRNVIRNAKYREVANKLGMFGSPYGDNFRQETSNRIGDKGIEAIGISVGNRDATAHGVTQPDITFAELESAYKAAEEMVGAAMNALDQ